MRSLKALLVAVIGSLFVFLMSKVDHLLECKGHVVSKKWQSIELQKIKKML